MTRDLRPFVQGHRVARYQSMFGEQRGGQYRVRCADGTVRTATATAEADSMFTIPARVQAHGHTVSGFVYVETAGTMTDSEVATAATDGTGLPGYGETDGTVSACYRFTGQGTNRRLVEPVPTAACGRTDPHGGHATPERRPAFCAGNINIVEGKI